MRAIDEGDIQARCAANQKVYEIIHHLDMTLDMKQGGSIAQNLTQLYGFILRKLPSIDFDNDKAVAEEIIGLLEPLRESWRELARQTPAAPQGGGYAAPAQGGYGNNGYSGGNQDRPQPGNRSVLFSA
jgi:flagellar protein FliS